MMRKYKTLLPAALLLGALGGCSLSVPEASPCESNDECSERFGLTAVCTDGGFCEEAAVPRRCESTYPADLYDNEEYRGALVLGALGDESLQSERGRRQAVELAVRLSDQQGGLDGRPVGVIFCNTEEDFEGDGLQPVEASLEAAQYLTGRLQLPAIIGPSSSTEAEVTYYSVVRPRSAMLISPAATSESLTGLDPLPASDASPGLFWRTAPPNLAIGSAIAQDLLARGVTSIQLVGVAGYGQSLGNTIQTDLQAAGVDVVDSTLRIWQLGDTARRDLEIDEALQSDAEEVVFLASDAHDTVAFIEAFSSHPGSEGKRAFLSETALNADFLAADGGDKFGVRPSTDADAPADYHVRVARFKRPASLVYENFVQAYTAVYGEDPDNLSFSAHAFDATWLTLLGAAWSIRDSEDARVTGQGIARGLRKLSDKERGLKFSLEQSQWRPIQAQIAAGVTLDIEGASGQLDYDGQTEEISAEAEIAVVVPSGSGFMFQPAYPQDSE